MRMYVPYVEMCIRLSVSMFVYDCNQLTSQLNGQLWCSDTGQLTGLRNGRCTDQLTNQLTF